MRANLYKSSLLKSVLAASAILLASGVSFAGSVNLTAAPTQAVLSDGQSVPMWGYSCNTAQPDQTSVSNPATCAASNPNAATAGNWSPVVITVPYTESSPGVSNTSLTINLTNNLPVPVPTSLVIVGQLGGGLGTTATFTDSPIHAVQGPTWPAAGDTSGAAFNPPAQPQRVQSFATEVFNAVTTPLVWNNLKPGTYLIESGTHPSIQGPMGLYGVLVVTTTANGSTPASAYPGVTYDADVALLLSEIDPLQNRAVATAVATPGFSETATIALRDVLSAISVDNPGMGYTSAPTVTLAGGGYTTPASAHINPSDIIVTGVVNTISVGSHGSGYSSPPAVAITGGGGSGASATANMIGLVGQITVDIAGNCYSSAPAVSITNGGGSGATATAQLSGNFGNLRRRVTGITVTNPGNNYTSIPTVTIAAPTSNSNGCNSANRIKATAHAVLTQSVASITVNNHGSGYTSAPTVTIMPPASGTTATATAGIVNTGVVSNITLDSAGAGYSSVPSVTLTGGGSPTVIAQASAALTLVAGQICSGGAAACYPPAVNYDPRYYLINGISFDRTNLATSTFAGPAATATTGNVLLRFVNAGLRMHVPSVVGQNMALYAEDGNLLPGIPKVQNEVFLAAGKVYDVGIKPTQTVAGTYDAATFPVYDRQLSLSTNNQRDGGMQAYITVAGGASSGVGTTAGSGTSLPVSLAAKTYFCVAGTTLSVTDPSKGVLGGVTGANGAVLDSAAGLAESAGLSFNSDGTFSYTTAGSACGGTFTFKVNGTLSASATITQCDATINSDPACAAVVAAAPVAADAIFTSNVASRYASPPPGVLASVTNPGGLVLTAATTSTVALNPDGSFVATGPGTACPTLSPAAPAGATCVQFPYQAMNSQGTLSNIATATVIFMPASNLVVNLKDAKNGLPIGDYRWIIEEDKTLWIDPKCQVNATGTRLDSRGLPCPALPVESLGYNFHTANMPVVAEGCVGTVSCEAGQSLGGTPAVCDVGNGQCRTDGTTQKTPVDPGQVHLDPNKRYYISVMPGDGVTSAGGSTQTSAVADPTVTKGPTPGMRPFDIAKDCGPYDPGNAHWIPGSNDCGHTMGGAPIAQGQQAVTISLNETPLPPAKLSIFVFQDDNPLNGENDAGGGVDVLAPQEPGLSGFEIKLFDQAGGLGDNTGQPTYDVFNMPLTNSLAGQIDPITQLDACPITKNPDRLIGMIPTCPTYESDGKTLSPLAGQAVIDNLYPGLYEVQAYPAADRIARGEEWLQTNTLDGGKPHEAFLKPNEPGYFQEFGPGGFHVAIGFANPKIINNRKAGYCATSATPCNATLNVQVTNAHMSRTPDQRTFSSETYDQYSFTQCYVSVGPADAEDFALQKCNPDGTVSFTGMPTGVFKISVFDQWNDIMLDGLVSTVTIDGNSATKVFPVTQWRTNLYTRTYFDTNGDGVSNVDSQGNATEPGLPLIATNIRYRDGSFGFFNNTDLNGFAGWNEVFPFMNWLVVESDTTRYKTTGVHVVYDAGGAVDCSAQATALGMPCSNIAANLANTKERVSLPDALRVPGSVYCADADCSVQNLLTNPTGGGVNGSTGRIDPPWANTQGWQGLLGQNTFMEFGRKPFAAGENGGIKGHVVYASTRPFDDPSLLLQLSWEPLVPHVTINLYQEGTAADGSTSLKLVDTTTTTSWDDWAQGFRRDANGNLVKDANGDYIPNMNCPGQDATSPFFATLQNSKEWLDTSNPKLSLSNKSQFKCYDGWSQLNQAQPAPYDGMYKFPSVVAKASGTVGVPGALPLPTDTPILELDPKTYKTNCTICTLSPDGTPMLPAGKYVVEVIVPPGFELVKEEDKNILMGDTYVAPVTQQFAGLGSVFIMPDQAAINAYYNNNNPQIRNSNLGLTTFPRHEGDTGSIESYWPCVGAKRIVPDYMSLFPGTGQNSPFAGALRSLCDRKEVTLQDQASALAKFYIFSSTHIAGHFTGGITDDFASEFDPFSPQFGEKFGPPNLPVALKDFNGNEVSRVYADQWGAYNGLYFSTWGVNPPNPTGYAPQMAIACMNDPGPIPDPAHPGQMITDPMYNSAYSNFCYEMPFMPGFTAYMDTPVTPTQSFADNYNLPDTEYPDGTPAIMKVVNSDSTKPQGPWVSVSGPVTSVTPGFSRGSFTAVPTVNFNNTGTGGSSAAAVAAMGVNTVNAVNAANRYSAGTPTVTFHPTACPASVPCVNAVGTVIMTGTGTSRRVGSITVSAANMGSGFTTPGAVTVTVSCTGTCSQQTAVTTSVASLRINSFVITNGGSGYTSAPSVSLAPGGGASTPTATISTSASGSLTITALGDKVVPNPAFSGPSSTTAPFNQKTITRHYGFGATQGSGTVTIGGVAAAVTAWADDHINVNVPSGLPNCSVQQRNQPAAKCGELVITRGDNGKQTIDAITVTAGGSAPWIVTPNDFASNTGGNVTAPAGKTVHDYGTNFGRMFYSPLQVAIDSADPGDLILVSPGTYRENLIMWKPVRLQGVGAASVTINADAHPAGKMDQWRRQVNCAFGLTLEGVPSDGIPSRASGTPTPTSYDASGTYSCPAPMFFRVDRIPFEAIVGWDASGNGNLAQVLQEPTLMGSYEGAGITVLGRGERIPNGNTDFWGQNATGGAGAFTDGSVYLGSGNADCTASTTLTNGTDYGTSNYFCNPSRIDGISIINSSQGGGGVFVHGWAHNLEVANTRISGNSGTLAGAINVGNGETPDAFINDGVACGVNPPVMPCPPIPQGTALNAAIPFQFNMNVRIHHNMLYNNASIGDALFSGTPAGAGGVTVSAGADGYLIDHNWIAGNLSTGDGGGLQHLGLSFNGRINNNYVLFNQSTNPTLPTDGGGIVIEGANIDRQILINGVLTECGSTTDVDCPPGLAEGAGAGLVLDANLIIGNSAESGSGGGLRIQQINGSEVVAFPGTNSQWYDLTVTNNIIANNVAGWDGGGVSIQDALMVSFVNNTVASNDTTASAGSLFKTLGAINSASGAPGCHNDPNNGAVLICPGGEGVNPHGPQPAGLVAVGHTANLIDALAPLAVTCPSASTTVNISSISRTSGTVTVTTSSPTTLSVGNSVTIAGTGNNTLNGQHTVTVVVSTTVFRYTAGAGNTAVINNSGTVTYSAGGPYSSLANSCKSVSLPVMVNDLFWQNRAFSVTIVGMGSGNQSQQNLIALMPALNQVATGACPSGANFWDIGLRTDDLTAGTISASVRMVVNNSIYTSDPQGKIIVSPSNTVGGSSPVVAQYCNGARVPPENCAAQAGQVSQASCKGYNTPAGASETTGLAQVFTFNGIQPTATVDEGHNWLNLVYGPLSLGRPNVSTPTNAEMMLASRSYGTAEGAYSIPGNSSAVSRGTTAGLPATAASDFFGNPRSGHNDAGAVQFTSESFASVGPADVDFGNVRLNTTSAAQTVTLTAGNTALSGIGIAVAGTGFAQSGGTCTANLAANSSCTILVTFAPGATLGSATGSVTITPAGVVGSPVTLHGTGAKIDVSVTPVTLLSFGDVFVGSTSATQLVTLTNSTSAPVAAVTGVGFAISGPFARSTTTAGTCPATATFSLAATGAGSSCTIGVVFKPTALNPAVGSLTVTADAGFVIDGSPVQMTGNGQLPVVTPASLNFGNVPVGTPVQQTLTLGFAINANSSDSLALPMSIAVSGAGYSRPTGTAGGTCGASLAAGATCTIVVQFSQPVASTPTGTTAGSVTITGTGSASGIVLPVPLTANSIAATHTASVSPSSFDFGGVTATMNLTQNLTVTNTGNSALGGMTITGVTTTSSPFARVTTGSFPAGAPNCGTTLAVGATCTIKVQFAPTALGSAVATVTVGGAGATAPTPSVSATLTGNGLAPPAPATPTGGFAFRGGTGNPITASLSWNAAQYASSYDVQWSTSLASINANTGTVITSATTTNPTLFTPYVFNGGANGIAANTTVYFKVRAVNITGSSGWSGSFNSTVR